MNTDLKCPHCTVTLPGRSLRYHVDVFHGWLSNHDERLDRAGDEIRELKAQAAEVAARLERLDAMATAPHAVRRATLNQVWDRLMDTGDVAGALVVSKMRDELAQTKYTADVVVVDADDRVLLIMRRYEPFEGCWALPGGHVDAGETTREAAVRELAEETGVVVKPESLFRIGTFDAPRRDPRGPYSTDAYLARVPAGTTVTAGDDASDFMWTPLLQVVEGDEDAVAFDHHEIVKAVWNLVKTGA